MANQTRQLEDLLRSENVRVEVVQVNRPYWPTWIESVRGVRAVFRLAPYLFALWKSIGRAQLVHVMANSGWSWHLLAAPAIWIAQFRRVPVVVNYRGGDAERFFEKSFSVVRPTLARAAVVVVPSRFLASLFERYGIIVRIVPNIIDTARFSPRDGAPPSTHLIVTRNLEPIYDVATAIRAFSTVRRHHPDARLTVAGTGVERAALQDLAFELGVADAVAFAGRIENRDIPELYRSASLMLNPSTVDNMPISILEAWASGVPVVSTNAGGIPFLAEDGRNAVLVEPRQPDAMAHAALRVLDSPLLAASLARAGLTAAEAFTWPKVREAWFEIYASILRQDLHTRPMSASK
jgi:glycosyltransferase involved in cell wall biosynthesis